LVLATLGLALLPLSSFAQSTGAQILSVGFFQTQPQTASTPTYGSYLGLQLLDVDADRAKVLKLDEDRGVEVKGVADGGPADIAGIQPGDVLLTYNGENILGARHVVRLLAETPIGRKIKIQFWREGKMHTSIVTTGAFPRPDALGSSSGLNFPDGRFLSSTASVIPRPLLVWRDVLFGMEFEELDPQLSEYFGVSGGVLVRALEKGYPADKAGLRAGDVVVSVSHRTVLTAHDFTSCLRKPGSSAALVIMRNRKKLDLTLSLPGNDQ
jgi:serine protease Do